MPGRRHRRRLRRRLSRSALARQLSLAGRGQKLWSVLRVRGSCLAVRFSGVWLGRGRPGVPSPGAPCCVGGLCGACAVWTPQHRIAVSLDNPPSKLLLIKRHHTARSRRAARSWARCAGATGPSAIKLCNARSRRRGTGGRGFIRLVRVRVSVRVDVSHWTCLTLKVREKFRRSFVTDLTKFRHLFIRQPVGFVSQSTGRKPPKDI